MKKQITLNQFKEMSYDQREALPRAQLTRLEGEQARETLTTILSECVKDQNGKPIVYTKLGHVSKSGMMRKIRLYVANKDSGIEDITFYASRAMSEGMDDKGIMVRGCGMDMGFDLVYRLAWSLFRDERNGSQTTTPDCGYFLSQKWL